MDYSNLLINSNGKQSKVGIIGATRGYGYTLLAQIPKVKNMQLRAICSRHPEKSFEVLTEIGFEKNQILFCETIEQIKNASESCIIIISDYRLIVECNITALVECTGDTSVSSDIAMAALNKGINVYMVSKETDSVCGPILNHIAAKNNAVYALVNGDQPRNLLDLLSWAKLLGLEIIAAGKSSEYDFVINMENNEFTYLDGQTPSEYLPELLNYWDYEGLNTLQSRKKILQKYLDVIPADLCEMNLVSNITGLLPATPSLDYPILKINELADVFIPEEDGGILKNSGVVNVFYQLRRPDEASFSGGEFIIVKCNNEKTWNILKEKGHIVSHNQKYACIYLPYHYMGIETPISILLGDFMNIGTHPECRQITVMAGIAKRDLEKGTKLQVQGHHHSINGLIPQLLKQHDAVNIAPFYLLNGTVLLKDIKQGDFITLDDVNLSASAAYHLYQKGLSL